MINSLARIEKKHVPVREIFEQLSITNPNFGKYSKKLGGMDFRKKISFLREDDTYIYVPRNFPLERYNIDILEDTSTPGRAASIKFTKELRDYQKEFFSKNDLFESPDRIINAGCGSGKTVMSLWVISQIKLRTLVVVPTNFLVEQYEERANFFTDAVVGIGSPTKPIPENCDILIMTYGLFLSRDWSEDFLNQFGHLVVDEGHRIGADSFEQIIPKVPAMFRTLITATFRREDGAEKVLLWHFGKLFKMKNVNPLVGVTIAHTGITLSGFQKVGKLSIKDLDKLSEELRYANIDFVLKEGYLVLLGTVGRAAIEKVKYKLTKKLGDFLDKTFRNDSFATLDSALAIIPERNEKILSLARKKVEEGKKVLILSKRKNQLFDFSKVLTEMGVRSKIMVGKANKGGDTSFEEGTYDVILGIDKLAKEGADLPDLDVLILCHLFGDPEQALGRVARIVEGKKPEAYFLLDDNKMCKGLLNKASKIIPNNGYIAGNTIL